VKVEPHWGAELVDIMDAYDAAVKGTVDMAHFFPAHSPGRFPMEEMVTFSSYDTTCWRVSRVYWELHQKFPEMGAAFNDTKLISVSQMFQRGVATTEKPIRKLEDMKGMKMLSSGVWAGARWEALGCTPVDVGPGEIFMALEKGLIDGSPTPLYLLEDWGVGELYHYVTLVCTATPIFAIAMNLDTFNSLPADVQGIMVEMGEYLVDFLDDVQLQVDKERLPRAAEKFDIEFIEVPKEELARWVEADKPVVEKFVAGLEEKGLPGKELLEEFRQLEKKYAAPEYAPK
jgi:TRAP-type C4-dicarboxylate transport system substrate-binding protein